MRQHLITAAVVAMSAGLMSAGLAWAEAPPDCGQLRDARLAIASCTAFLAAKPADKHDLSQAYFYRGTAFGMSGRLGEAVTDLEAAIKADPNWAPPYNNRARAYVGSGEPAKAIPDYTRVLEINPRDAGAYINRALAYLKLKDHDHALADLQRGGELDPRNAFALFNLGLLYEEKGDRAQAEVAYRRVLTLVPNDPHATESLKRIGAKL